MNLCVEFVLRLLLAGVLGTAIGLEREYRAKNAGYRTHFLVAFGSALMMIVSKHAFDDVLADGITRYDPGRIAAQVVTGIGFIGAGTIILQKHIVRGLTTAAGIWATSGIGMAVGAGMYALGIAAAIVTLAGLELLSVFFRTLGLKSSLIVFVTENKQLPAQVMARFERHDDFMVETYTMKPDRSTGGTQLYRVEIVVKTTHPKNGTPLRLLMEEFPEITILQVE